MDHIKLLKDISAELIRQENGHHEVNNIVTNAVRKHGLDLDNLPGSLSSRYYVCCRKVTICL